MRRIQPGPLALRAVVFVAAAIGLWAALPDQLAEPRLLLPVGALALLSAAAPNTRAVGSVMLLTIALWLATTLGFGEEAGAVRTFVVACALYLTHSAAALAALLPPDSIVDKQVMLRWAARSGLVVFGSGLVTAGIVALAPRLTPTTSVWTVLLGLAATAGLISLLAWSVGGHRRV